jgi:hypothetical protein
MNISFPKKATLVKGGHPIHNEIIGNDANTLIL